MTMGQWIPSPENRTSRQKPVQQVRAQPNGKPININLETLEISPNAPLTLEFERLVGRSQKPPLEEEFIVFSKQDLKDLAQKVKGANQDEIAMKDEVAMKERLRNAILPKTPEAAGKDPSTSGTKRKTNSDNSKSKKKRKKN
jgi:hypothetical protein